MEEQNFIENILKDWSRNIKDKKSLILRYFNPAGAHKSGLIGENPKGFLITFFLFITQSYLENKNY